VAIPAVTKTQTAISQRFRRSTQELSESRSLWKGVEVPLFVWSRPCFRTRAVSIPQKAELLCVIERGFQHAQASLLESCLSLHAIGGNSRQIAAGKTRDRLSGDRWSVRLRDGTLPNHAALIAPRFNSNDSQGARCVSMQRISASRLNAALR